MTSTGGGDASSGTASTGGNAYLFNLTSSDVVSLALQGVPITGEIKAINASGQFQPAAPLTMTATSFISTSLKVEFADGRSWTQGINLQSRFQDGVKDIAIWIFSVGYVVSDSTGSIYQLAW